MCRLDWSGCKLNSPTVGGSRMGLSELYSRGAGCFQWRQEGGKADEAWSCEAVSVTQHFMGMAWQEKMREYM